MNVFADLGRELMHRPGDPEPRPQRIKVMPPPHVMPAVANRWGLRPMECEVMRLSVEEALRTKEIAHRLSRNEKTIEAHKCNIIERMGARNFLHAALLWDRQMRANAVQKAGAT